MHAIVCSIMAVEITLEHASTFTFNTLETLAAFANECC